MSMPEGRVHQQGVQLGGVERIHMGCLDRHTIRSSTQGTAGISSGGFCT
jgi:hypothetical protein